MHKDRLTAFTGGPRPLILIVAHRSGYTNGPNN